MHVTAIFAMLWAVARAHIQSITIDEADTYLAWVAGTYPSHWTAASNNHVLNSLLMRLTTSIFGPSHLAVRAPALFGAAIYILSALMLCRLVAPALITQWALFVSLVFNPFIFDHLVAARGYALALGFLMAALAIAAYAHDRKWSQAKACAACSICLALSFAANFSFAIVDFFAMVSIAVWACARTQAIQQRARILSASVLPGLLTSLFISAPAALKFSRGDLVYGSHSVREWLGEVVRDSLWQLNPQIVNPLLMRVLIWISPVLIPAVLLLAVWQWRRAGNYPFVCVLLAIVTASTLTHWTAFHFLHVLLPKERTAIWIVPLVMLAAGAVASGKRPLTFALCALGLYFVLCLRLNYFREWSWDADVNRIYSVLAYYNHTYGETEVTSHWMYSAALNFYRVASGSESLHEIPGPIEHPAGHRIYVLNWVSDEAFIKQEGLRVVYRAPSTEAVVAIRPEVEAAFSHRRMSLKDGDTELLSENVF